MAAGPAPPAGFSRQEGPARGQFRRAAVTCRGVRRSPNSTQTDSRGGRQMPFVKHRPRRWDPRLVRVLIVLGTASLVAASCSSPSSSRSVASLPGHAGSAHSSAALTESQNDQDMVDFARCLRSHGVAEPDPFHRPGHVGLSVEVPAAGTEHELGPGGLQPLHYTDRAREGRRGRGRNSLPGCPPSPATPSACGATTFRCSTPTPRVRSISATSPASRAISAGTHRSSDPPTAPAVILLPAAVHDDGTGP